jgi:hypothetical protein
VNENTQILNYSHSDGIHFPATQNTYSYLLVNGGEAAYLRLGENRSCEPSESSSFDLSLRIALRSNPNSPETKYNANSYIHEIFCDSMLVLAAQKLWCTAGSQNGLTSKVQAIK